jgi:hypothetical protein
VAHLVDGRVPERRAPRHGERVRPLRLARDVDVLLDDVDDAPVLTDGVPPAMFG